MTLHHSQRCVDLRNTTSGGTLYVSPDPSKMALQVSSVEPSTVLAKAS